MPSPHVYIHSCSFQDYQRHPFWKTLVLSSQKSCDSTLVIVPTTQARQSVQHFLGVQHSLTRLPEVITLEQLLLTCFPGATATPAGLEPLILKSLLDKEGPTLPGIEGLHLFPGFITSFLDFYKHSLFQLLTASNMRKAFKRLELADTLSPLMEAFSTQLAALAPGHFYATFHFHLRHNFRHFKSFLKPYHCYAIGFHPTSPLERLVLKKCAAFSKSFTLFSPCNTHATPLIQHLKTAFPESITSHSDSETSPAHITATRFSTEIEEVKAIINQVCTLIDTKQAALSEMAIVSPSPLYTQLIEKIGTPFGLISANKNSISTPSPWVQLFQDMSDALTATQWQQGVRLLFRLSFVKQIKHENSPPLTLQPDLLDHVLSTLPKTCSLSAAPAAIDCALQKLSDQWAAYPETVTIDNNQDMQHQCACLHVLIRFYTQLAEATSSKQLVSTLLSFLLDVACFEHHSLLSSPHHPELLSGFYTVQQKLITFQGYYHTLFQTYSSALFFNHFIEFLQHAPPPKKIQVQQYLRIYSPHEAAFTHHRYCFLPGCTDSFWPNFKTIGTFLNREEKKSCRYQQYGHIYQTSQSIFKTLLYSSESVFVSYPSTFQGGQSIPSHFLSEEALSFSDYTVTTQYTHELNHHIHSKKVTDYSQYNALITFKADASHSLFNQWFNARSFSVSQLELHQKCAYHYYLKYVLKLRDLEQVTDTVQATVWGTLVHSIFQRYYETLTQSPGAKRQPLLMRIAGDLFESTSVDNFYWAIKRDLLFGTPTTTGLLQLFLNVETEHSFGLIPTYFEHTFSIPIAKFPQHTLKGVIDVVLTTPDGQKMVVQDYKTGSILPSGKDIATFKSLQLSTYMLALQKMHPLKTISGGIYFQLKSMSQYGKHVPISTAEAKKEVFDLGRKRPFISEPSFFLALENHLSKTVASIEQKQFRWQHNSICRYCDYTSICREEKRFI